MGKRPTVSTDAAAPATDAADAAIETPTAADADMESHVSDTTDTADVLAPAANIETAPAPDAAGVELTPEAADVLRLTAALAGTPENSPFHAVLAQALADAEGMQALALAEAERQAERATEESNAIAAAAAFNLADDVLNRMLAAIAERYAPAPDVEAEAAPAAPAPATGRKPVGVVAATRNAEVAAALSTDTALAQRVLGTIQAFDKAGGICYVGAGAGTRYASVMAFAGDGVANYADYSILVTAIRQTLALPPYSLHVGGQTVADRAWTTGTGAHAATGAKSNDALYLKFADKRAPALYADGRFRYALPSTPNVRFLHTDAGACAAFLGGAAAASTPAAAPVAPTAPAKPHVPTAPDAIALPSGGLTKTARCQHCQKRNAVTDAACEQCHSTDWQAK